MFTLTAFIFTYCTFALLIHLLGFTFNLQPKIPPNKKKKKAMILFVANMLLEHWYFLFDATHKIYEPDSPNVENLPA